MARMDSEPAFGIVLWSTDVFALAGFLERVTGAVPLAKHPGFADLGFGSARITVHADESYRGHPWFDAVTREGVARGIGAELRFEVADANGAYAEALKAGAQSIAPPYDADAVRECTVMGPDGYLMSLWQSLP
ncbi:MAG: hypothetical protein C0506_08575 [Anaerolinea sp.]|nr:hypothetical protein [Anaerolinea sp.]